MELRHLRCFLAVAEELHFARAADRLHIEQSPLSRAIKELEEDLGAQLFVRTTRSTRLTRAGRMFLEHVPRVFASLQQARDSVKAAANGFHGQLRIALSDCITPSCFSALLALCRQEEPEIEIRLSEVSLSQQVKGLQDDLYDVGFAQLDEAGDGLIAEPVWHDPLMVAVPARHPLLAYKHLPLDEVLRYPLALGDSNACEGHARQVERVLRRINQEPLIAERVASFDLMMTLVSAGFALGLAGASQIAASRERTVVARPLAGHSHTLTTYLLRVDGEPSDPLARFIERVYAIEPPKGKSSVARTKSDTESVARHRRQVQQHRESRRALDQGADGGTVQADDDVFLPVTWDSTAGNLGWALADHHLGRQKRLAPLPGPGTRRRAPRPWTYNAWWMAS